jgi:hypothetical protein
MRFWGSHDGSELCINLTTMQASDHGRIRANCGDHASNSPTSALITNLPTRRDYTTRSLFGDEGATLKVEGI